MICDDNLILHLIQLIKPISRLTQSDLCVNILWLNNIQGNFMLSSLLKLLFLTSKAINKLSTDELELHIQRIRHIQKPTKTTCNALTIFSGSIIVFSTSTSLHVYTGEFEPLIPYFAFIAFWTVVTSFFIKWRLTVITKRVVFRLQSKNDILEAQNNQKLSVLSTQN